MKNNLLLKGVEIELYAGTESGEVLPLSVKLKEKFPDFSQEPDQRNFEYITKPNRNYYELFKEIIETRINIRNYLKSLGNLTLIPGSTIALPFSKEFYFSKPGDPYSEIILDTYKTKVITTSIHINIGIDNYDDLFKCLCIVRLYTPLFLALSASSCFYDGMITGFKSYRWHNFPKAPSFVPFFTKHEDYITWINKQLEIKNMFNIRHLWTSIRPNGLDRPYDLNRIEIRICDFIMDTRKALSIVALIECIIQDYLVNKNWPKILQTDLNKLVTIFENQEELVAKDGLNAKIWNWKDDSEEKASSIIESLYKEYKKTAKDMNILEYLNPILEILKDDNEATQFMKMYNKTGSIEKTMQYFIEQFTIIDLTSANMIKVK
ncbi:MAG: putative glutamate--cysteine ligase [Candidatus Melainabacteria bacterium RIFCSPLOWO2_02_FULL_35_15]|nr:MAG: putative glutamate--cysteine ligase [Candidatus Melainabacteria bacterium RIFCSPLOWO2_12_FULL_35_11]OGI13538.1 MAG: putative glutamate--cysteine ligase [Candidatus Melainabacteria bacterium RIFCSPLOWO2_02_FULL_35_15]